MRFYATVSYLNERPSYDPKIAAPWAYVHFPNDWFYYNGEWLPQLSVFSFELPIGGGFDYCNRPWSVDQFANFIKENDHGKMLYNATLIIPSDPDLDQYKEYVRLIRPLDQSGNIYPTMWDSWVLEGRKITTEFDRVGYNEFLRHLIKKSIIQPPSIKTLLKLISWPMVTCSDMIRDNPEANYKSEDLIKEMCDSIIKMLKESKKENRSVPLAYIDNCLYETERIKSLEIQHPNLKGEVSSFFPWYDENLVQAFKNIKEFLELRA